MTGTDCLQVIKYETGKNLTKSVLPHDSGQRGMTGFHLLEFGFGRGGGGSGGHG